MVEANVRPTRLMALDALRGFDMFWIIGGDFLVHFLAAASGLPLLAVISDQLRHVPWQGFHFYDLVFPLFMFVSGVAFALTLSRRYAQGAGRWQILKGAAWRFAVLVLLGIIYNFGWNLDLARFRLPSVLGLIGGAYFITVVIFVFIPGTIGRLAALFVIALFIAILQLAVPVPGFGAGVLTPEGAINGWIDRSVLPGRLHGTSYDPEGVLGVLSGSCITLCGAVVGSRFSQSTHLARDVLTIGLVGLVVFGLGWAATPVYPAIKKLWTVPFVVIASGASMVLLSVFLYIIEIREHRRWAFFFTVIGMNSIFIYMAARFFTYPIFKLVSGDDWPALLSALVVTGVIALEWLTLYGMVRYRIFLRI